MAQASNKVCFRFKPGSENDDCIRFIHDLYERFNLVGDFTKFMGDAPSQQEHTLVLEKSNPDEVSAFLSLQANVDAASIRVI